MQSDQPQIAVDPNLAPEQAQAQKTLIESLQTQAQDDTANLMSRYGARLALGNAGLSSTAPPVTAPVVRF